MPKAKKAAKAKRITFEQAKRLYKDEWVVFSDANIDLKKGQFVDGVVYWHGPDQQECYRKAAEVKGPGGSFYTGRIPYRQVVLTEENEHRKRVA